jgi:hypothetical protein
MYPALQRNVSHFHFHKTHLKNEKWQPWSHVVTMHRIGDPWQTAVSDLSKVILCLVALKFEQSNLVVRAQQHNHSATAVLWIGFLVS